MPKNILMMGPTGVGKTEIARRLARIMEAPFIKVEATKYTEVGYVGRDVESIIRDLVEASVRICFSAKAMYRSPSAAGTKPLSSTSAEAMIAAADASRGVEARAGASKSQ